MKRKTRSKVDRAPNEDSSRHADVLNPNLRDRGKLMPFIERLLK